MATREEELTAYLKAKFARLCPHRLDADFDIEHGVALNYIWHQYGCIKTHCAAWDRYDSYCRAFGEKNPLYSQD